MRRVGGGYSPSKGIRPGTDAYPGPGRPKANGLGQAIRMAPPKYGMRWMDMNCSRFLDIRGRYGRYPGRRMASGWRPQAEMALRRCGAQQMAGNCFPSEDIPIPWCLFPGRRTGSG